MKIVCAWCGLLMREVQSAAHNGRLSHGICEACRVALMKDWEATRISKWESQPAKEEASTV
jgi:hypothetical protein